MVGIGRLWRGSPTRSPTARRDAELPRRIGESVRGDPQLAEHVRMMVDAKSGSSDRQAGPGVRPPRASRSSGRRSTRGRIHAANAGQRSRQNIHIETKLGKVPAVGGDPYAQEVLSTWWRMPCRDASGGSRPCGRRSSRGRATGTGTVAVEIPTPGKESRERRIASSSRSSPREAMREGPAWDWRSRMMISRWAAHPCQRPPTAPRSASSSRPLATKSREPTDSYAANGTSARFPNAAPSASLLVPQLQLGNLSPTHHRPTPAPGHLNHAHPRS